jgi:hypothetical protein
MGSSFKFLSDTSQNRVDIVQAQGEIVYAIRHGSDFEVTRTFVLFVTNPFVGANSFCMGDSDYPQLGD